MIYNFKAGIIELDESEADTLLKLAHGTEFTTGQVVDRLMATYSANFEQDVADTIADLEEAQ